MFDRMVIPGMASFASNGLPAPAQTDDGNPWIDGFCWLYCGQRWTRVLWIGPVSVAGIQAPMFARSPCITELHERVWQSVLCADRPPEAEPDRLNHADATSRRRRGRHRGRNEALQS